MGKTCHLIPAFDENDCGNVKCNADGRKRNTDVLRIQRYSVFIVHMDGAPGESDKGRAMQANNDMMRTNVHAPSYILWSMEQYEWESVRTAGRCFAFISIIVEVEK